MPEFNMLDPEDPGLGIAVSADEETWLPFLVLALPIGDDFVGVAMSPEEALRIGSSMISIAVEVENLSSKLQDKTVEERREIIMMESQFMGPARGECDGSG